MGGETLLDIFKGAQAIAPLGQGFADRNASRNNAGVFRTQGRQALAAAAANEAVQRREGTQAIAQQVASAAAEGQSGSSAMDVIRQNDINLRRDALMLRARGQAEAEGYRSRASMAELEGDRALYSGLQGMGSELLKSEFERRGRRRADITI